MQKSLAPMMEHLCAVYFFSNTEMCIIILRRERVKRGPVQAQSGESYKHARRGNRAHPNHRHTYTLIWPNGTESLKPLAPAIHQSLASSLVSCTIAIHIPPSKTHLFLYFNSTWPLAQPKESTPFRLQLSMCCKAWYHQITKLTLSAPGVCCSRLTRIHFLRIHIWLANAAHFPLDHKEGTSLFSGWSRPRRAKRSAAQHQLRGQPNENFVANGSPSFPNQFPWLNSMATTNKH